MALKPGIITGKDYITLVEACKAGGYALPAVNVTDINSLNAALEAAANAKSDIIIQLSNGGARYYGGSSLPDTIDVKVKGAVSAARHAHMMAADYGIGVVLHTDHANRKLLPWIDGLIEAGKKHFEETGAPLFSSHMLDLSEETLEDNISISADYLKKLHEIDMSIEIELGVTGGEEDGVGSDLVEGADNSHLYTQPDEVLTAYKALDGLGHFTIAAAFGNVHGVYKPGNVVLRPEILDQSQKHIEKICGLGHNPLHFVFHGGSGSEKAKIAEAVSYGAFKMNIDTDTQFACANGIGKYVEANREAFFHQMHPETGAPLKKFYDPRKWGREIQKSMATRLMEAMDDLGSTGKSICR